MVDAHGSSVDRVKQVRQPHRGLGMRGRVGAAADGIGEEAQHVGELVVGAEGDLFRVVLPLDPDDWNMRLGRGEGAVEGEMPGRPRCCMIGGSTTRCGRASTSWSRSRSPAGARRVPSARFAAQVGAAAPRDLAPGRGLACQGRPAGRADRRGRPGHRNRDRPKGRAWGHHRHHGQRPKHHRVRPGRPHRHRPHQRLNPPWLPGNTAPSEEDRVLLGEFDQPVCSR